MKKLMCKHAFLSQNPFMGLIVVVMIIGMGRCPGGGGPAGGLWGDFSCDKLRDIYRKHPALLACNTASCFRVVITPQKR